MKENPKIVPAVFGYKGTDGEQMRDQTLGLS